MAIYFMLFRFYPILALGFILALVEVALFYRRKGNKKGQMVCIAGAVVLGISSILWLYFGGFYYSDDWLKAIIN